MGCRERLPWTYGVCSTPCSSRTFVNLAGDRVGESRIVVLRRCALWARADVTVRVEQA